MHIIQRRHATTLSFHFGAEKLRHKRADSQGAHAVELPYASIGMDPRVVTERNQTLLTGAVLLFLWGFAQGAFFLLHGDALGAIFLFPGPVCLLLHAASAVTLTYLHSDEGEIAILHDSKHESLLLEIRNRRKAQLLNWYGNINFANDPDDEIKKFHWLHSQDLISETELEQIIAAIRSALRAGQEEPEDSSLPQQ